MKVYLCLRDGQLMLSDRYIHRGSKDELLTVGFPVFRFDLKEVLEGSAVKIQNHFGLIEGKSVKLELRAWPEG